MRWVMVALVVGVIGCGGEDIDGPGCHDLGGPSVPMLCEHTWRCDGVDYRYRVQWMSVGSVAYRVTCVEGDVLGVVGQKVAPDSWPRGPSVCEGTAAQVAEAMCGWGFE